MTDKDLRHMERLALYYQNRAYAENIFAHRARDFFYRSSARDFQLSAAFHANAAMEMVSMITAIEAIENRKEAA